MGYLPLPRLFLYLFISLGTLKCPSTCLNVIYDIIDNGDIGNGWKYVEILNKKHAFSLPKCLYYKGKVMKDLLTYTEYIGHLDVSKDFMNDFVKDIFYLVKNLHKLYFF